MPQFGLPPLGIAQAIGFSVVMAMLTKQTSNCEPEEKDAIKRILNGCAQAFVGPLMALAFGYIVRQFI